jgi:hypothetical protein
MEKDNSDTIYLVMDENDYFNQSYNLVLRTQETTPVRTGASR